jgi:hypothetical protein
MVLRDIENPYLPQPNMGFSREGVKYINPLAVLAGRRRLHEDPAKAFKRAKALPSAVQDLMSEFPGLEQLRACDEELNDLISTGVEAFKSDASQKTPRAPTEVRKPAPQAPAETTETEEVEPAMGVSDLLDEALRDIERA